MDPRIRVGGLFFDSPAVVKSLREDEKAVLSRVGFFTMKDARQSLRKRKRPSRPGEPPTVWAGYIKRFTYFAFDPETRSVVIGPARLSGTKNPDSLKTLEEGGRAYNVRARRKTDIAARPTMQPAFSRQLAKPLPPPWGK